MCGTAHQTALFNGTNLFHAVKVDVRRPVIPYVNEFHVQRMLVVNGNTKKAVKEQTHSKIEMESVCAVCTQEKNRSVEIERLYVVFIFCRHKVCD